MRKLLSFVVGFMLLAPTAYAESVPFTVSAAVPAATGVQITATHVTAATNTFGPKVTALNFNPLSFIPGPTNNINIWLPDHYFAIDVGATGGAGSPNVTVAYTEGAKPAGQVNGLGYKTLATFTKITGGPTPADQVQTDLVAHGPKKPLKNLIGAGEVINNSELTGGFFRVYVGVFPGDDAAVLAMGGEPFTNGDKPGDYDGVLTITATLP